MLSATVLYEEVMIEMDINDKYSEGVYINNIKGLIKYQKILKIISLTATPAPGN